MVMGELEGAVIYIGHLPDGFFEEEMREYFSQFGTVLNACVSRTRKNGRSKGYGFVHFEHEEVAQIAADTMNNYMMFRKVLKCHVMPKERCSRKMFRKRMIYPSKVGMLSRERYNNPKLLTPSQEKRQLNIRTKKLDSKLKKLKDELDYEFTVDMPPEVVTFSQPVKKDLASRESKKNEKKSRKIQKKGSVNGKLVPNKKNDVITKSKQRAKSESSNARSSEGKEFNDKKTLISESVSKITTAIQPTLDAAANISVNSANDVPTNVSCNVSVNKATEETDATMTSDTVVKERASNDANVLQVSSELPGSSISKSEDKYFAMIRRSMVKAPTKLKQTDADVPAPKTRRASAATTTKKTQKASTRISPRLTRSLAKKRLSLAS